MQLSSYKLHYILIIQALLGCPPIRYLDITDQFPRLAISKPWQANVLNMARLQKDRPEKVSVLVIQTYPCLESFVVRQRVKPGPVGCNPNLTVVLLGWIVYKLHSELVPGQGLVGPHVEIVGGIGIVLKI